MVQSHCDGFEHAQLPNLVLSKTLPPKPCPGSAHEILHLAPFPYLSFSAQEAVTPSGICSCVNPGQKFTDSAAEHLNFQFCSRVSTSVTHKNESKAATPFATDSGRRGYTYDNEAQEGEGNL